MPVCGRRSCGPNAGWSMPIWAATSSSSGSPAPEKGRSGGYRLLIAFRPTDRAVFMLGFAKSDRDNITPDELNSLKSVAALWLAAGTAKIEAAVAEGALVEVNYEDEK
jgi:hypothetical protein